MEESEMASWFQHSFENSIDKEFSDYFYEMLTADPIPADKQPVLHSHDSAIHALKSSFDDSAAGINFSGHRNAIHEEASSNETMVGMGESSSKKIIPSSVWGNNGAQSNLEISHTLSCERRAKDSLPRFSLDHLQDSAYEPTIASSSGGSRRSSANHGSKRKARDAEESEGFSEEAEYESAEANKSAQRPASGRRSRSAEVHNLSERRRRDKINEKMRALQELIPHCNKSDKASMLDEAIEYLKSLQLQLQLMWMGNGMAPISLPDIQQYMMCSGIKTSPQNTPSDDCSMEKQPVLCPFQVSSSTNFDQLPDQYSSYFGFPQISIPCQGMSICPYGPQMMLQNHMVSTSADKQHTDDKSFI